MEKQVLPKVREQIKKYQAEHHGEKPLYIIMTSDEADIFMEEVKVEEGHDDHVVVTEFKGSKVVKHPGVKSGEIRLTNEMPETSS
jgi:hypothetical protein